MLFLTENCLAPLEGDISDSIKMGGAYKPKESPFIVTKLCDDTCLLGWLSAYPVHSQTFKPTPASFTHKTNHHNQRARNSSSVLLISVVGFLQTSVQPHESAARLLQRATHHIKGTCPYFDSGCCHGKS